MEINKHYGIFTEYEGIYYFRALSQTYKIEKFNYNLIKFLSTMFRFNKFLIMTDEKRIGRSEITFPVYNKEDKCNIILGFESYYEEYKRHSYECSNSITDHSFKTVKLASVDYFEYILPEKNIMGDTIEVQASLHFFLFIYNFLSDNDKYEILDIALMGQDIRWFFKEFIDSSMPSERSIKKYIIKENFE